ncbi:fimbrial biogenesis chaperone [Cedecea sp.]|jgi:P pilus assembly chaperone PapD|uniref:fimbrial biogenesis chaperone n=1 Tax=Cedecea sp. TaxID=1970739 RepID=UPI0012AE6066|nr:fimbria/pilus periplasmic chaperone [Enterobacteriaceae bacterium RIT693]
MSLFSLKTTLALTVVIACALISLSTFAALTPDRTRIVFDEDNRSVSIMITNDNKQLPFLAQSWLEDAGHKKVHSPLMVMPPLQRINGGEKSLVRIVASPAIATLPADKESLFYFNLLEVPPRPEKSNVMQIALQSQIKLFYRPKAIKPERGAVWQDKLIFHKQAGGLRIENPTPYYVTLSRISRNFHKDGGGVIKGFTPVMIAPKASENVSLPEGLPNQFVVSYINDYGGQPEIKFSCKGSTGCRVAGDQ